MALTIGEQDNLIVTVIHTIEEVAKAIEALIHLFDGDNDSEEVAIAKEAHKTCPGAIDSLKELLTTPIP
jgi:hypothetical protein